MLFPIIVFFVAIAIAGIAAWFSIAGLMAIFAASAIPVAIMAGSLEVGKLISASWVYRNWQRAPFFLKTYLTVAVIVLMFITSMGIFGYLSKAHLEQAAQGQESTARIERIVQDIARYENSTKRLEVKITKLDTESTVDTTSIQNQITAEQERMDMAYNRVQPAVDEQMQIIADEKQDADERVGDYANQLNRVNATIDKMEKYIENDEISKLQALIGVRVDGKFGWITSQKSDQFRMKLEEDRNRLSDIVESIRRNIDTSAIDVAKEEIKRLRLIADREITNSQSTIENLRRQLSDVMEVDNDGEIDQLQERVRTNDTSIDALYEEKFTLESEVRSLEAEVGPIKYIAELVYGNTDIGTIDDAVRWLIIIFIFVFDPLAVLLLIAANYSFIHRNDHETRQEEIFESIFKKKQKKNDKKDEKSLDISTSMSDNSKSEVTKETVEQSPEEIQREINTEAIKQDGWLDDLDNKGK